MFTVTTRPRRKVTVEPREYRKKEITKRLAIFDSETDPFEIDPESPEGKPQARVVRPFTCGFYDGEEYADFWGDDCIEQFFAYLAERKDEEFLIYIHNGGNFDFYVPQPNGKCMLHYLDEGSRPFIMNGRLVKLSLQDQEFRDSYSLIPVALSEYQKTEIDYDKFKRPVRAQHEAEIRAYQKDDCVFLYELVKGVVDEAGDRLTMASVALPMLRSFHGFDTMTEATDDQMRPFYFGGRCEAFEVGELHPDTGKRWEIRDVNSEYPYVMANYLHPVSSRPVMEKRITKRTHFAKIDATSMGALPIRKDDGGLEFPHGRRTFFATIHEIRAGLELGLLRIHRVHYSLYFKAETTFDTFINTFYSRRLEAKAAGDKVRTLFYKLVMNSSYGKLAQDPRRYESFVFDPPEMPLPLRCGAGCEEEMEDEARCQDCCAGRKSWDGWAPHTVTHGRIVWSRPQTRSRHNSFFNVATAASITGAARAYLLRGIAKADRPIYVDTDSIICQGLDLPEDDKILGGWKNEASGDVAYIAAKKLYAVMDEGTEVKKASKGVKLTADEIRRVCLGEVIEYAHPVPKFKLDGSVETTVRNIRRTERV